MQHNEKQKINELEMKCLRSKAGVIKRDKMKNELIDRTDMI